MYDFLSKGAGRILHPQGSRRLHYADGERLEMGLQANLRAFDYGDTCRAVLQPGVCLVRSERLSSESLAIDRELTESPRSLRDLEKNLSGQLIGNTVGYVQRVVLGRDAVKRNIILLGNCIRNHVQTTPTTTTGGLPPWQITLDARMGQLTWNGRYERPGSEVKDLKDIPMPIPEGEVVRPLKVGEMDEKGVTLEEDGFWE